MQDVLRKPTTFWSGAIATLICCFTPVLVGLFTLVGLGALVGYIDYPLMLLVGFFITAVMRVYAWRGAGPSAQALGAAALALLAIFFGPFNLIFAVLIATGAAVALLAYRQGRSRVPREPGRSARGVHRIARIRGPRCSRS